MFFPYFMLATRSGPPLAINQNPVCKKAQLLHSDVVQNASLEGQLQAGNFTFLGAVKDMEECMSLCCASKRCQLAYMDKAKCYGVKCYSEELCKITTGISTNDVKISLMVRNDINRKGKEVLSSGVLFSYLKINVYTVMTRGL